MSKISIKCDCCEKWFERDLREYKRSQKLGRKSYCSRACSAKDVINNIPVEKRYNVDHLNKGRVKDEYSLFREHARRAKRRDKEFSLDIKYIKEVWDKQGGVCPYSGVNLVLPTFSKKTYKDPIYTASLDRIDSSKGYVEGNVQFISMSMNYMKSTMSDGDTKKLCSIISKFWEGK